MLKIKRINNGAVLKDEEGNEEAFVFDDDNLEELCQMLLSVLYSFQAGNRHARQKIEIKIVHGDKYDCQEKTCEICNG